MRGAYQQPFMPSDSLECNLVKTVFSKVGGCFRATWSWPNGVHDAIDAKAYCIRESEVLGSFLTIRLLLEEVTFFEQSHT